MSHRRDANEAHQTFTETAGRREAVAPAHSSGDVSVLGFVVAGGLRGFTVDEMFGGRE